MHLTLLTGVTDLAQAAVVSPTDRRLLDDLEPLVLGDAAPITVTFVDDTGATPAWAIDPAYLVSCALGGMTTRGEERYTWAELPLVGDVRTGTLDLSVDRLRSAVYNAMCGTRHVGAWLVLHVWRTDAEGNRETYALLTVLVNGLVASNPVPTPPPIENYLTAQETHQLYATKGELADAEEAILADAAADATNKANAAANFAVQRSNHTGEQAISTVTGLQAELDGKAPAGIAPARAPRGGIRSEGLGPVATIPAGVVDVGADSWSYGEFVSIPNTRPNAPWWIVSNGGTASTQQPNSFQLYITSTSPSGRMVIAFRDNVASGGTAFSAAVPIPPASNAWGFFVYVVDRVTDTVTFYYDGISLGAVSIAAFAGQSFTSASNMCWKARSTASAGVQGEAWFVRDVLTPQQVADITRAGSIAPFASQFTFLCWPDFEGARFARQARDLTFSGQRIILDSAGLTPIPNPEEGSYTQQGLTANGELLDTAGVLPTDAMLVDVVVRNTSANTVYGFALGSASDGDQLTTRTDIPPGGRVVLHIREPDLSTLTTGTAPWGRVYYSALSWNSGTINLAIRARRERGL